MLRSLLYYGRKINDCPCTAAAILNGIPQLFSILFLTLIDPRLTDYLGGGGGDDENGFWGFWAVTLEEKGYVKRLSPTLSRILVITP